MAYESYVLVCGGTACCSGGADKIVEAFANELEAAGLKQKVQVVTTGCLGFCEQGPIVKILPQGTFYVQVKAEDVKEIVAEHLVKGRVVQRLCYDPEQAKKLVAEANIPFYQKQYRIVLRNCGVIDPEKIEDYIARDGYKAIEKVLFEMTPEQVVDEMLKSGLRGRGGAGFPTGMKWKFAQQQPKGQKYMVCNADEGDPGAYMDRSTLEGDPHSILEAMTIAGYAIGASKGFIYIRAEYPLAIHRLQVAIGQAHELGLLGDDILGSGFSFDIELRFGAGAFVCGEETALLQSIEGNRGMPKPRPPFPAVKGLWGRPTVINNVETLANIPVIINKGADWFSKIGTATTKGTKVFALSSARSSSTSAAASAAATSSRRPRRAVPPAASSRRSSSTPRSTTSRSPRSARSWARAASSSWTRPTASSTSPSSTSTSRSTRAAASARRAASAAGSFSTT